MSKKHIITIAGSLGSGKSSTAKNVAIMLGYEHASTGDFMRSIATDRGISLVELNKIAETDSSIDTSLDNYNRNIGEQENIVLDSRLGFYFVPDSFKVFLDLDPNIAALRILNDKKNNSNRQKEDSNSFDSVDIISKSITERLLSEKKRYKEMYGIDNTSKNNFDLVIDTSSFPMAKVSEKIIEEYYKWLDN